MGVRTPVHDGAHHTFYPDLPSLTSAGGSPNGSHPFGDDCRLKQEDAAGQYSWNHARPNHGLDAHGDAAMPVMDGPPGSVGYEGLSSGQRAVSGLQTQRNHHMAAHRLQNSKSSSSLTEPQSACSARSQNSRQSTTIEHGNTSNVSEEIYEFRHYSFAPQNHVSELSSTGATFEFVMENPLNPQCFRERRVRSRSDIEQQKEGSRLLKEFGGSCMWCFRSKKRCGPAHPCESCVKADRKCIRSSEQLCLLVPSTTSEDKVIMQPPSREALDMLHDLARNGALNGTMCVGIHLRRPGDDGLETWVMDITEADLELSKSTQDDVAQFFDKSIACIHCSQLGSLQELYGHHPVVHAALKMAFTFLAMCCLTKTSIHLQSSTTDTGKFAIFLILVAGSRNLAEMSALFSADLCEALRRKDLHDSWSTGSYRPRGEDPLNPIWLATGLYYRVVCGLLDLEHSSPITKIFGSLETQLVGVRKNLWSILKSISIDNAPKSKRKPKSTLNEQIPVMSFARHFDVAFWQGTIDSSDEFGPSGLLKRQADTFAPRGHKMESFLQEEVRHPSHLPRGPQPVRWDPGLTLLKPSHQRSVPDPSSLSETSNTSSMDIEQTSEPARGILDSLQPTLWDTMSSIDSAYRELDGCE